MWDSSFVSAPGRIAGVNRSIPSRSIPFLVLAQLVSALLLQAVPPVEGDPSPSAGADREFMKQIDLPNAKEVARIKQRLEWRKQQRQAGKDIGREPSYLQGPSHDKILVILVEFAGTNTFTWTPGSSTWDPIGKCDNSEFDGANLANGPASSFLAQKYGITGPTNFTYHGPLHNQIPRPLGSNHTSSSSVWIQDFSPTHFSNLIFGAGIVFDFARQDGSVVREDFTDKSVRDYYEDISAKTYSISGNILGWLKLTNSVWWYGADGLPGARSTQSRPSSAGAIPGAGSYRSLVIESLQSARAAYPDLNWSSFDQDGDGIVDRLWIIHAGYGEEDNPTLLNATTYGEATLWSHSSALGTPYEIVPGVSANAYIMMPENAGIAVLAHEFAHNLGAIDLYTYGEGQTSAGFWTLMSDSWVGFPLGFLPEAMDPMHLDNWGWLNPLVISDPSRVYAATIGQASHFPGGSNVVRGVRIDLSDGVVPLAVRPRGAWQWWGGQEVLSAGGMTLRLPVRIPSDGATLEFQTAYDTEANYDFLYVETSTNNGSSWQQLAAWSGRSTGFPAYQARSLPLGSFTDHELLVRFRYTTDEYLLGEGAFVDDVVIKAGDTVLLSDDAESDRNLWTYRAPWIRNSGNGGYSHKFYLQWRNTSASGGYDQALGDPRFRFGPANSGLLVWYQDDRYFDNRIGDHLSDPPSFGPKGKLLVVDAHPEPYLDPYWSGRGVANERGIVFSRGLMRDAPFSRWPSVDFSLGPPFAFEPTTFAGRSPVHRFSDAQGFYPGIQEVAAGQWRTWQWDASVVIPSKTPYGVRGGGYWPGASLERIVATRTFVGTNELLAYTTNAITGGSALPGGSGNPGDVDGQYGWNVWIVHQTNSFAEVVIWNGHFSELDADIDGIPNWKEAIAGTDPNSSDSYLRLTQVEFDEKNKTLRVEWSSASHRRYRLWRTTDPLTVPWTAVGTNLMATPPLNYFEDSAPPSTGPVFYRVEVE